MTVQDYMNLPYTISIQHCIDGGGNYYSAKVNELDGCMSDGATQEEAARNIREAMEGWFETAIENDVPIPIPQ